MKTMNQKAIKRDTYKCIKAIKKDSYERDSYKCFY